MPQLPHHPMGRRSLLNRDIQEKITAAVAAGVSIKAACLACGISVATAHGWAHRGIIEQERRNAGQPRDRSAQKYLDFSQSLAQADARGEMALTLILSKAAREGNWQAAHALLKGRYWNRNWGNAARMQPSADDPLGFGVQVQWTPPATPGQVQETVNLVDEVARVRAQLGTLPIDELRRMERQLALEAGDQHGLVVDVSPEPADQAAGLVIAPEPEPEDDDDEDGETWAEPTPIR